MRTTTFDFSTLFRTTVGFDRLSHLPDSAARIEDSALTYPPYDIEQIDENRYGITMALAGFREEDLDLTVHGKRCLRRTLISIDACRHQLSARVITRRLEVK